MQHGIESCFHLGFKVAFHAKHLLIADLIPRTNEAA
jgi:hypothetical protein